MTATTHRTGRGGGTLPALLLALALAAGFAAGPASAAGDMPHHGQAHGPHAQPVEPGQSAFAALAEIVAILQADPATDWQQVDLGALRRHLVDMDELTMRAVAVEEPAPGGLRIRVSGAGRTGEAVRAMVPAHAAELDRMPGWTARAELDGADAILVVAAGEPGEVARIRGLGFFGLMATGAHHQAHHLAIARGAHVHGHQGAPPGR